MSADGEFLNPADAYAIGEKVVEMADRVRKVNPAVPGATAAWTFKLDGTEFDVKVAMRKPDGGVLRE